MEGSACHSSKIPHAAAETEGPTCYKTWHSQLDREVDRLKKKKKLPGRESVTSLPYLPIRTSWETQNTWILCLTPSLIYCLWISWDDALRWCCDSMKRLSAMPLSFVEFHHDLLLTWVFLPIQKWNTRSSFSIWVRPWAHFVCVCVCVCDGWAKGTWRCVNTLVWGEQWGTERSLLWVILTQGQRVTPASA